MFTNRRLFITKNSKVVNIVNERYKLRRLVWESRNQRHIKFTFQSAYVAIVFSFYRILNKWQFQRRHIAGVLLENSKLSALEFRLKSGRRSRPSYCRVFQLLTGVTLYFFILHFCTFRRQWFFILKFGWVSIFRSKEQPFTDLYYFSLLQYKILLLLLIVDFIESNIVIIRSYIEKFYNKNV